LPTHKAKQNCKRATEPTHHDRPNGRAKWTGKQTYEQEGRTANKVLPKAGLNGFDWAFVQGSTFVLRLNFSAKNPRLRQYPKRYV